MHAYAASALGTVADGDELPWTTWISAGSNYLASPTSLTSPDRLGILDVL